MHHEKFPGSQSEPHRRYIEEELKENKVRKSFRVNFQEDRKSASEKRRCNKDIHNGEDTGIR